MNNLKLFKLPKDLVWVIFSLLFLIGIIFSNNNITNLCSYLGIIFILFIWFMIVFRPWRAIKKSIRLRYSGITFCYKRAFTAQERVDIKQCIDYVIQRLETSLRLSKVCIIDDALDDATVFFVDDISDVSFNKIYKTNYRKLFSWTSNTRITKVELSTDIKNSALKHEISHIILENCSVYKGDIVEQHFLISKFIDNKK